MKTHLITLLTTLFIAVQAMAHGDVELGPNGGRLVEFGDHQSLHAEFALKDGRFLVKLYDEETKKIMPVTDQVLIVTHKEANRKLTPELKDGGWILPKPDGADFWLIVQLKDNANAKAKNGRLHYDETICSKCKAAEWVCKCDANEPAK